MIKDFDYHKPGLLKFIDKGGLKNFFQTPPNITPYDHQKVMQFPQFQLKKLAVIMNPFSGGGKKKIRSKVILFLKSLQNARI